MVRLTVGKRSDECVHRAAIMRRCHEEVVFATDDEVVMTFDHNVANESLNLGAAQRPLSRFERLTT